MNDVAQYLLANAYSSFSPALNAATVVCSVNGQDVACPSFIGFVGPAAFIVLLAFVLVMIVSVWKIFTKAAQPGWASIIPIYNWIVMLKIVKKPTWWVILAFVPFINLIFACIVTYQLAKTFGKGIGYALGLLILPFVFYPMLAFGKAVYMPTQPAQA